jgi:hypothetical protein
MTAIGLVGLNDGFVLGADGRKTGDKEAQQLAGAASERISEDAQKIFPLTDIDRVLAYAVSGFVTLDDFVVLDEVKRKMEWLIKRTFDNGSKYFVAVIEKVTEEINEAKRTNQIKQFPVSRKTERGDAWKIADILIAGYYSGTPMLEIAQITHSDGEEAKCDVTVPPDYRYAFLLGSDAVRRAMYPDGGGARDPRFQRYVKDSVQSLKDAEEYISGYIEACASDLGRELDPESWRITGGRTHLARITPSSGGFEWIVAPGARH